MLYKFKVWFFNLLYKILTISLHYIMILNFLFLCVIFGSFFLAVTSQYEISYVKPIKLVFVNHDIRVVFNLYSWLEFVEPFFVFVNF